ncbi:hypothetical protein [Kitasatospora sp. NPDC001527]|uniref:hypothetical protein n=1 Tax=Kitasatospora sp. NPDC001527 TaxID=3154519 RepID=UPI00331F3203
MRLTTVGEALLPHARGMLAAWEDAETAAANGQGVVLPAAGNAPLVARDEVVAAPVRGVSPSRLAVAARRGDERPLVLAYLAAAAAAGAGTAR